MKEAQPEKSKGVQTAERPLAKALPMMLGIGLGWMFINLALQKIYSPDLGFHLAADRWMSEHGGWPPKTDPFSTLGEGRPYIDLHWLYQKATAASYRMLGFKGPGLLQIAFSTSALIVLLLRSRKADGSLPLLLAPLLFLGLPMLSSEPRPHGLSWLLLGLVLFALERAWKGHRAWWLLPPALGLLWANTHSLYILGWVAQGAWILGKKLGSERIPREAWWALGATVLFSAFTPYGLNGLAYPWEQFGLISSGLKKEYIGEFQSPMSLSELKVYGLGYLVYPLFWSQLLSLLALGVALYELSRKRLDRAFLLLGFSGVWFLGIKNFGYFFFAVLPILASSIEEIAHSKTSWSMRAQRLSAPALLWIVLIGSIIIGRTAQTDGYAQLIRSPHRFGTGADSAQLPLGAAHFIAENVPKARLMNPVDFGGTFDFFQPHPVHIDGRMEIWSDADFEAYASSLKDPKMAARYFEKYKPDLAAFPYLKTTGWWVFLMNNPEWKLVYVDGLAAVYARTAEHPELARLEPLHRGALSPESIERMNLLGKQKPTPPLGLWARSLLRPIEKDTESANLSMFWLSTGQPAEGLERMIQAIENSSTPPESALENWKILKGNL